MGITIVLQHKSCKVVGPKGKRQVASLSSAERGALVTVVTCMSASGHFVAPLIFPQEEYKIRVTGWRTSWHDWYLSHLWLDPGRVIYAVVQAFYFYCQTHD
jgi:hypothetical protein